MAEQPDLRASDADRERVVEQLRRHLADGRLDLAEFEERAEAAYGARMVGDLRPLLADLPTLRRSGGPPVRAGSPEARVRRGREVAARAGGRSVSPELAGYFRFWVALSMLFVVIWLLTSGLGDGDNYFWPVWPMFGTAVPMLFMLAGRR